MPTIACETQTSYSDVPSPVLQVCLLLERESNANPCALIKNRLFILALSCNLAHISMTVIAFKNSRSNGHNAENATEVREGYYQGLRCDDTSLSHFPEFAP